MIVTTIVTIAVKGLTLPMFEWDDTKRIINLSKHGIDFIMAKEIWQNPVLESPSQQKQHGENRIIAIGKINNEYITVIYTWRGKNRRLISARKARKNEQANYIHATR